MNIHEYQAKAIFADNGIPTLKGKVAFSVDEAVANAKELGGSVWAVKAQFMQEAVVLVVVLKSLKI